MTTRGVTATSKVRRMGRGIGTVRQTTMSYSAVPVEQAGRPPSMEKIQQWAQADGRRAIEEQVATPTARCTKCHKVYPLTSIRWVHHWMNGDEEVCTFCVNGHTQP